MPKLHQFAGRRPSAVEPVPNSAPDESRAPTAIASDGFWSAVMEHSGDLFLIFVDTPWLGVALLPILFLIACAANRNAQLRSERRKRPLYSRLAGRRESRD